MSLLLIQICCVSLTSCEDFTSSSVKLPKDSVVVPDDFPTIQKAVYNASWGGTVFVRNGIYSELVTINKSLSLIGEDRENTIISAPQLTDLLTYAVIEVQAEGVTVSGFTLKDAQVGIKIAKEPHKTPPRSRCTITDNCEIGVFTESGENHLISGNSITGNGEVGIYCRTTSSTISRNNITGNNGPGIIINSCGIVVIRYNKISENNGGVGLHWDGWFHVYGNNITNNQGYGIEFGEGCRNSTISQNNIEHNDVGINLLNFGLEGSASIGSGNQVSLNNIQYNLQQVSVDTEWDLAETFPERNNITDGISWNSSKRGNYWSDYTTKYPNALEIGDTKVGDTTYVIDENNVDYYPLTKKVKIPLAPSLEPSDSPLKIVAFVATVATVVAFVFFAYKANRKKEQKIRRLSRHYEKSVT